jgi:DNA-binding ferritin-like protein
MEDIASMFFHSRTQTHQFHTKVTGPGSLAIHQALQEYYEAIIPLMDGIVEAYQGMNGLISYKKVAGVDNDATKENILNYFDDLIKFLETKRKDEKLQVSWIQNELDNLAKLLYSTKYKLTYLG